MPILVVSIKSILDFKVLWRCRKNLSRLSTNTRSAWNFESPNTNYFSYFFYD